jgi:S1-C subfamily serine protease
VNAEVTMLTGATAGKRMVLSGGEITVGRSTDTDFQLNPFQDLRVSGHHAAFVLHGQGWAIRDLGSRNGTFLNGRRISEPSSLRDGDQIQFGENGPVAVFRLLHPAEGLPPLPPAVHPNTLSEADFTACYATAPGGDEPPSPQGVPQPAPTLAPQAVGAGSPRARESWRGPTLVVGLSVALLATGLLALHSWRQGHRHREQVLVMQQRIDSILEASAVSADALQGRIEGLHDALQDSREHLGRARRELGAAQSAGNTAEIAALRVQVQEAQAALVRQQLAANLDFDAIEAANGLAVVKVYVDFGGEVITATAFAVREDATLLTNRHVVLGPGGDRTPQRVAAQFADSRQVWPARVVATSDVDDLAVLKVDNIVGGVPTILGFNTRPDTVQAGQGVAVIGFPLGGADLAAGEGSGTVARTTLTAGVVSAIREGRMEVNGYGVEGSSGSPIFDGDGKLVGVLYGGRVVDGERTLFAVSVDRVAAFLRKVP